jgi:WD40 repeat protein
MKKQTIVSMAACALIVAAGVTGGARVRAGADLVIQQVRTIEAPRVFHPGADDKGGYWEDFGITTAFDFSLGSGLLVAVLEKVNAPTRLFVFDLLKGNIRFRPIISKSGRAHIKAISLSPDGGTAAIPMGADQQIALWNVATGTLIVQAAVDGAADDVHWHPAGQTLAVVAGKNVEIWQFASGALTRQRSIRASRSATEFPMAARWSPDGEYLAIGTNAPAVYISKGNAQSPALTPATKGSVYMVEWNAAGDRLATAGFGSGSEIAIWRDPKQAVDSPFDRKYELLQKIPPPAGQPWRKLTWDPTGQLLAFGEMSTLGIWDAASGSLVKSIAAHPKSAVLEAHWKGDSLITVGAFPDKHFRIWSVTR